MATQSFEIGEQVIIEREIRELKELARNVNGDLVIIWGSKYSTGACVPSLWCDWRNGKGENY